MKIFEKNITAIAKKDSILAERLRAFDIEKAVKLGVSKKGEPVLSYRGRLFNSQYAPWKEAEVQAGEILKKKPDCVVIFGLGCAYLLRTLLKKGMKKVFVLEPSMEILKGVLMEVDLSRELSLPGVFLANYIGPFIAWVQRFTDGLDNILGYHTLAYSLAFPEELRNFVIKVENAHTSQKVGIRTEIDSRLDWLKNYFANLENFAAYPSVGVLNNRLRGVPLVIVGAGPSLKKNAALLSGIKDRAFIVSAITAYKSLLKYGVTPHAVIAGEKVDLKEYFDGGVADENIRLILSEVSHPEMFRRRARGKFIFYSPYIALSLEQAGLWGSSSFVSIGGSVTTAMFDMGVTFGCDPIIFIGQDLAFENGQSHAEGGVYDRQRVEIDEEKGLILVREHYISGHRRTMTHKLQWLTGLDGRPVASKYDWVTFHQWFERYMVLLKEQFPGLRVYNSTEGGAYIKGMEHLPLAEVIEQHLKGPVPVEKILDEAGAVRPDVNAGGLLEAFRGLEKHVGLVLNLSSEIIREAGRLKRAFLEKGLSLELSGPIERIRKKEKKLFKAALKVSFLWEALVEYTYDLKGYLREEEDGSARIQFEKDIERTIRTYSEVRKMCLLFKPMIGHGLEVARGLVDGPDSGGRAVVNEK